MGEDNCKDIGPGLALGNMDPKYSDKINEYQSKMKVLLYNYQILERNDLNLPEATVIANKQKIEKYLVKLSKKQTKLTEKWMKEQKRQEEDKSPTPEDDENISEENTSKNPNSAENTSNNEDDEESAKASKTGSPEPEEDVASAASVNIKDRMAMVRGMRNKKKKGNGNGRGSSAAAKQRLERANSNAIALGLDVNAELVLKPGQFRADITDDEIALNSVLELPNDLVTGMGDTEYTEEAAEVAKEFTFKAIDLNQFMLNIGLLTPVNCNKVEKRWLEERKVKNHWRNLTYIPEISDRKHRVRYTYLSPEIGSPPMLRGRQQNQGATAIAIAAARKKQAAAAAAGLPRRPRKPDL